MIYYLSCIKYKYVAALQETIFSHTSMNLIGAHYKKVVDAKLSVFITNNNSNASRSITTKLIYILLLQSFH